MDKDTQEILTESEKLRLLTEHEGWGIVRNLFINKVIELRSTDSLDLSLPPDRVILDVKANDVASKILFEVLNDIEGTVSQAKENASLLPPKGSYIVRT